MNESASTAAAKSIAVIIPAAGSGQRFGGQANKLFALLAGKPLWQHAIERFNHRDDVATIVMAVSESDRPMFIEQMRRLRSQVPIVIVQGGAARSDSVRNALASIGDESGIDRVAIHDAARPLVRQRDLDAVFAKAAQTGAAILAAPVSGTLKRAPGDDCLTVDRRNMYIALTPQVFAIDVIRQAYARDRGRDATDDAQLVERTSQPVSVVLGSADNLKITYPEDLRVAEAILHECLSDFV